MRIRHDWRGRWTRHVYSAGFLRPLLLTTLVLLGGMVVEGVSEGERQEGAKGELSASEMMVRAHDARAVWKDFPGFTAEIVVSEDGSSAAGRLTITGDGEVKLDFEKSSESEMSFAWAERKLESLAAHRRPADEREYDVSFADDATGHPLGRLIKFNEDRLHSLYRIQGDVIREVHRTMGETRFSISVVEIARNPAGKYLPAVYTVSYWDAKTGDLKRTDVTRDTWTRVGDFDLPARLLNVGTANDGKRTVRQIELRNHRLLTAGTTR